VEMGLSICIHVFFWLILLVVCHLCMLYMLLLNLQNHCLLFHIFLRIVLLILLLLIALFLLCLLFWNLVTYFLIHKNCFLLLLGKMNLWYIYLPNLIVLLVFANAHHLDFALVFHILRLIFFLSFLLLLHL